MRKLIFATAFATLTTGFAGAAMADGSDAPMDPPSVPLIEYERVTTHSSSSANAGLIVPLILLLAIIAAAASG